MALSFRVDLDNLFVGLVNTNPEPSAEFDVSPHVGNIFINVAQNAGGSDTLVVTVEHSLVSGSGFGAVPAAALFNPETGNADTFDNMVADATDQTLYLVRQQLKRFVRVVLTGASSNDNTASVVAGAMPGYTEQ
jgi:hypothetical protein